MRARIHRIGSEVGYPNQKKSDPRKCEVLDRKIIRYRSGRIYTRYLFKNLLERIVEDMTDRVDREFDNLVVIDGDEGVGKSSLAYKLCTMLDPTFTLEERYVYSLEEFLQKLTEDTTIRGKVFLFDEATNVANNRQWMETGNTIFTKILEKIRSRGLTMVLCIPFYGRLDKYVRTWRVKFRLKAHETSWERDREIKRGYFELQVPERKTMIDERTGEEYVVVKYRSYGYGKFPKVPAETWAEYNRVKDEHFDQSIQEDLEKLQGRRSNEEYKKDKASIGIMALALYEEGRSYQEIADMTGMNYQTLKGRVWAAKKAREREG